MIFRQKDERFAGQFLIAKKLDTTQLVDLARDDMGRTHTTPEAKPKLSLAKAGRLARLMAGPTEEEGKALTGGDDEDDAQQGLDYLDSVLSHLEKKTGPLSQTLMHEQEQTYAVAADPAAAAVGRATAGPVFEDSGFSQIAEETSAETSRWEPSPSGAGIGIRPVPLPPIAPLAEAPRPMRGDHLYSLGGFQGEILSSVETFASHMNAWVALAPMDSVRNFPAGVAHPANGRLYVCGGFDGRALSSSVEVYDPNTGRWSYVPAMGKGRYGHAAVVLNGLVYAIGGSDGDTRLVEAFDPETDTWRQVAPLNSARRFTAAAVIDGKIYAVGGRDAQRQDLSSVEVYDPSFDTWTPVAPMSTARKQHGVAVLGGKLYAVGGHTDAGGDTNSVEAYYPATNTWSAAAPMSSLRKQFGVAVVSGKLYAVGGDSVEGFTSAEAFDPLKNRWEPVAAMSTARYGHAVVGM